MTEGWEGPPRLRILTEYMQDISWKKIMFFQFHRSIGITCNDHWEVFFLFIVNVCLLAHSDIKRKKHCYLKLVQGKNTSKKSQELLVCLFWVFFHVFICISLFLYRIFTYLCFLQFPKVEKTSILKSEHLLWKQFNTTHTLED